MHYKKLLLLTCLWTLALFTAAGQVTTSSLVGTVTDANGQPLVGATVKATHLPSGTVYGTVTQANGTFAIQGMRVGGPYRVDVSYIGYQTGVYEGIQLRLGEPYNLTAQLKQTGQQLQELTVVSARKLAQERTGASTVINVEQLSTLPTVSRSIVDFTKLTPQSNGTSFAGRDGRYNNLQVDGANLNNNFGLSSDPLPGGGDQPISLDAYDQISVNIAPYDVRQSGFTGAGINAVTKSGTNTFHGSAYGYYRNQHFIGTHVGDVNIKNQIVNSSHSIYGATLGGPIIKNKLFFFVNAEFEKGNSPGISYSPKGGSGQGTVSSTPIDSLKKLADFLKTTYNYDPGAYDNFPNFETKNHKLLAKIDWNISTKHKLTVKYSDFVGTQDQQVNGSSIPNGGGFRVTGRTGTVSRLPNNRFSNNSMAFANSNYGFKNIVRTATAELNSNFNSKMANQFLLAYTRIRSTRTFPGKVFPTIDIFDGNGNNYISVGMDPFTYHNDVINNIFSATDNFTYYVKTHTITAGATFEYQRVGNMFMPGSESYYVYNTLNDFITNQPPVYYAYTYSLVNPGGGVYSANLKIGQLGIYVQDQYDVSRALRLTVGLRADKPIYLQQPLENPAITQLTFPDENGNMTHYSTGKWPKGSVLFSPRVGFRWDVKKDNTLIIRGGTGIFTGRIPFVWLTNMPTNSGMYQNSVRVTDPAQLVNYKFNPDPNAYLNNFPKTPSGTVPANIVLIDPNFKFPQIWRSDLAVDKSLGNGLVATVELMYTKDIHAVKMRNANLKDPDTVAIDAPGFVRPRYTSANNRYYYNNISSAIVLENTHKGYAYSITAQLSKSFSNGFYGSIAYTFTQSKSVTDNPGSQATSVWNSNPNVGTSNAVELGYSSYFVPHRVVADISYRFEYARHFATTISLFYQGENNGNYSFVVNGDLNNDGNNSTDLMYIPHNASEINFLPYSTKDANGNTITFSAQDQQAAFEKFINSSPYLKKHRGQYAERNAALYPWYNELDLKFLQDFYITTGKNQTRHNLQFSMDILNFLNLINKNWGIVKTTYTRNPLIFKGVDSNGVPQYNLQNIGGVLVDHAFQNVISPSSTWYMQLGLRYSF